MKLKNGRILNYPHYKCEKCEDLLGDIISLMENNRFTSQEDYDQYYVSLFEGLRIIHGSLDFHQEISQFEFELKIILKEVIKIQHSDIYINLENPIKNHIENLIRDLGVQDPKIYHHAIEKEGTAKFLIYRCKAIGNELDREIRKPHSDLSLGQLQNLLSIYSSTLKMIYDHLY